jgi:hypothetical protein
LQITYFIGQYYLTDGFYMADLKKATEYERLTQEVYQLLLKTEGVESITVQHNVDVLGRSGVSHQIDVLWKFRLARVEHMVAVECKNYNSRVDLLHARNFFAVLHDTGARGLLVTRVGFQSGAEKFCKYYGIDTKLLREPTESDWLGRIKNIEIAITVLEGVDGQRPIEVHFQLSAEAKPMVDAGARLASEPLELQLRDRAGNPVTPALQQWLPTKLPTQDLHGEGPHCESIKTPGCYLPMVLPSEEELLAPLDGFSAVYFTTKKYTEMFTIHGAEIVKAILNDFATGETEHIHRK